MLLYLMVLLLSAGVVWIVHPYLVKFAFGKNIVDKPNARKLNRIPVPVLGGVGVFFGFIVSIYIVVSIFHLEFPHSYMFPLLLMLGMGLVDDMCDLTPHTKFVVQILAVLLLYFFCDLRIDNLHGVFGVYEIPMVVSLPLSLVACVGLINSINLIDGIDGLSSGYSIVVSGLFAILAFVQGNTVNLLMSCALVGALVPFFIYNVFGKRNKMFIGDAGSHLLGVLFCIMALNVLDSSSCETELGAISIPFLLAVLSHPIMDTLRVMVMRICRGKSPFRADKTHLHHALVWRGLSHLTATVIIIGLNLLVVLAWLACYRCSMSATSQVVVVVAMSILCIVLPYPLLMRRR